MTGDDVLEELRSLAVDEELAAEARAALLSVLVDRDRRGLRGVGPHLAGVHVAARDAVRDRGRSAAVARIARDGLAACPESALTLPRAARTSP